MHGYAHQSWQPENLAHFRSRTTLTKRPKSRNTVEGRDTDPKHDSSHRCAWKSRIIL